MRVDVRAQARNVAPTRIERPLMLATSSVANPIRRPTRLKMSGSGAQWNRPQCLEDTAPGAGQLAVGKAEASPGNHHALATA